MANQRFSLPDPRWIARAADLAILSTRWVYGLVRRVRISGAQRRTCGWTFRRLGVPQIARIAIDALIVGVSLFLGQVFRTLVHSPVSASEAYQTLMPAAFAPETLQSMIMCTIIALLVFYWSGFYTFGRAYQGKYKLIIVTEAVAIAYLIIGTMAFLLPNLISLSRGVVVASWLVSWLALLHARLWATAWRAVRAPKVTGDGQKEAASPRAVLVIGGAGYIGSALVPKLLAQGCKVRILDVMMYGRESIANALRHPHCELVQADFRHVDVLVKAMRGINEVVHLGGLVGDPACAFDEELTIDINLAATRAVAEVAKGAGVRRFVFASTCSVYGASEEFLDERSALNPVSLYARTKIASERLLLAMSDEGFQPIIARFGTVYGISGRTRFDLVVNLLTAKAVLDGEITVHGGNQWRPFLHVEDAARAVLMLLETSISEGEWPFIFNVGSGRENYTIEQMAELIRAHVPSAKLIHVPFEDDRRNYRVSFSKVERAIGFTTNWTVEQGIRQVAELIRRGTVRNYRDPAYSNVTILRENGKAYLERPRPQWVKELIDDTAKLSELSTAVGT